MNNICIIGSGQLGSRHLQGIKLSKTPLNIIVFDLAADALQVAEIRYNEVESSVAHEIMFTSNLNDIPYKIDVAIISTSSGPRRKMVEELLKHKKVRYMILEKVLFQNLEDFDAVEELLKEKGTKAWVNCIRRNFRDYTEIKKAFCNQNAICNVTGNEWGMMCNLIHFIDYMSFVFEDITFKLDLESLLPELVPAKREGYYELYGTIIARFNNGRIGSITCNKGGEIDMTLSITGCEDQVVLCESRNIAYWRKIDGKSDFVEKYLSFPFQSQTTGELIEEILSTGNCKLTGYKESAILHKQMLQPIIHFINSKIDSKINYFPCT